MNTEANQKWQGLKRSMVLSLGLGAALGGAAVFWAWGFSAALAMVSAILCLALGFWITELLVAIFTRLKTANASATTLLFLGKALWWASLFIAAKYLPAGLEKAVAVGIGVFLLALFFSGLGQFGLPRISDGKLSS